MAILEIVGIYPFKNGDLTIVFCFPGRVISGYFTKKTMEITRFLQWPRAPPGEVRASRSPPMAQIDVDVRVTQTIPGENADWRHGPPR